MPLSVLQKLGYEEGDLKQTNLSLSGFSGEPTEARVVVSKELMVGSTLIPTTFFMVDVKGWYSILHERGPVGWQSRGNHKCKRRSVHHNG
jgi:hypothetical protein